MYTEKGNIFFEGYIKNGLFEGNGKLISTDGSYYLGQFKNGREYGKGKIYSKNGLLAYEGDIVNGNQKDLESYFMKMVVFFMKENLGII